MSDQSKLQEVLGEILRQYRDSFTGKAYDEENNDTDPLMDVFGITAGGNNCVHGGRLDCSYGRCHL